MAGRWRAWLTWTPPLMVAIVLFVALRGSDGSESVADPDSSSSEPISTSTPTSPGDAGSSPPTTGFADRVPSLPDDTFEYTSEALPAHLAPAAAFDSSPADNPVTDAGATLGRVLFYDVNLSRNHTVRCASCHQQTHSFTDPLVFSQGLDGFRTRRNSMSLANAAFNPSGRYLWDERAATLEEQVLLPFKDRGEMDLPPSAVLERIRERAYYQPLFEAAFGDDDVTEERLAAALAQFVRSLLSVSAPYDEGRVQVDDPLDNFPNFSAEENRGKELFLTSRSEGGAGCASCHATEAQISGATGLKNNGIDPPIAVSRAADLGAFEPTNDGTLAGSFRVPSLRNVEVTAPYMHDGRLLNLEQVIEHYSQGIQPHENLSVELRDADGQLFAKPFNRNEADALIAFLRTLTDRAFLTDPRFAEPFPSSEVAGS